MWERTGKGCNSINMKSGVCLDEETYAAYLRQKVNVKSCAYP